MKQAEATRSRQGNGNQSQKNQTGSLKQMEGKAFDVFGDMCEYGLKYMREQPETAALALIGVGFILGWKMKIW